MRWLFLFAALPLYAVYIGNPAGPALMNTGFFSAHYPFVKVTTGYVGDFVSDKRYEAASSPSGFDPNNAFRHFGLHSQLASVSAIFVERLEIFGLAGGSKEYLKWNENPSWSDATEMFLDFESSYQFSWGAGARVILLQWGPVFLSGDFTYFGVPSSHKSYFKFFNKFNLPLNTAAEQKFGLSEWETALALSAKIFFITPYAGVDYLYSNLYIQEGPAVPNLNYYNQEKIGYFYGLTVSLTGRFHLNFERRVRNEFAYGFSTIAVF